MIDTRRVTWTPGVDRLVVTHDPIEADLQRRIRRLNGHAAPSPDTSAPRYEFAPRGQP